jgi:hypothetical protein
MEPWVGKSLNTRIKYKKGKAIDAIHGEGIVLDHQWG